MRGSGLRLLWELGQTVRIASSSDAPPPPPLPMAAFFVIPSPPGNILRSDLDMCSNVLCPGYVNLVGLFAF